MPGTSFHPKTGSLMPERYSTLSALNSGTSLALYCVPGPNKLLSGFEFEWAILQRSSSRFHRELPDLNSGPQTSCSQSVSRSRI